jgi:VanZ family protein
MLNHFIFSMLKFLFILIFIFYGLGILYFSLFTIAVKVNSFTIVDKFIHLLVYFLWPFFIIFFYKNNSNKIIIFCFAFGIIIEFLQIFFNRNFDFFDICANFIGILICYFIFNISINIGNVKKT